MTAPNPTALPTQPPPPVPPTTVTPPPDSRLDQLAAEYAALKPLADEYAERLKTITDGIKAELTTAAPGATSIVLSSSYLSRPLRLQAVTRMQFDSTRLKKEHPEVWQLFAKASTSWRLAPTEG